MGKFITINKIKQQFWLAVANLPMPGHKVRPFFVKLAGVNIPDKHCFIGKNVSFDGVHPELITIEKGMRLTNGTSILTHYIDPAKNVFVYGKVHIKENAFIGKVTPS